MNEFILGFNDAHVMKTMGYLVGVVIYTIGGAGLAVSLIQIGAKILEVIRGK